MILCVCQKQERQNRREKAASFCDNSHYYQVHDMQRFSLNFKKAKLQILQIRITLLLRTNKKSTRFWGKILKKENLPGWNLRYHACDCFKNVTGEERAAGGLSGHWNLL